MCSICDINPAHNTNALLSQRIQINDVYNINTPECIFHWLIRMAVTKINVHFVSSLCNIQKAIDTQPRYHTQNANIRLVYFRYLKMCTFCHLR